MNTSIKYFLLLSFFSISCVSTQSKKSQDAIYTILNIELDNIVSKKKDTIYIEKQMINSQLKELINNKKLISRTNCEELKQLFNNDKEIDYLTSQLKDAFLINFKKIKSNKVKEYVDPFKRLDSTGSIIADNYYQKVLNARRYTFSQPIYSLNKEFILFMKSRHENSIVIRIYKNKNGKWEFFRNIGVSII